ncbi:co-chaperone GroES [Candidatus Pacearchaeota archaeon]|nr:co-chaperone GroES [Candidatus Pacearchaeota archaeon]HCX45258.1 co-chaperone GroES [Patescibacteria group bacterium]
MNIKPLNGNLFLEPIDEEKTTESGIVLPDTAEKQRPVRGKVIAAGPGNKNDQGQVIPMTVKVGDVVFFKQYGPDEVEVNDKRYLVVSESDILAIIE